jgi:predicted permease
MGFFKKLKNNLSGQAPGQDAADELAWHLEQRVQEYVDEGMTLEKAQRAARRQMGNVTALAEETAESDVLVRFDTLKREVMLALRMLRRAPTVAAVAVLSLGLGIGANTVVFTLMKQVVLDYLPVPEPERLVILHNPKEPEVGHTYRNDMNSSFSYPLYRDLDSATGKIFDGILAVRAINVSMSGREETESVHGDLVSGNFFQVLRVTPWRGRLFNASDDQNPGANPVVVLGFGLWKRSFGGDAKLVGQTISLNKHPYVVVGIAPPQFYGLNVSDRDDLYVPMSMKADVVADTHLLSDRLDHWANLVGRLKAGVSEQQASAALSVIYPRLLEQDFAFMKGSSARFRERYLAKRIQLASGGQGYTSLRDEMSNPLKILMAMVGIVLLITIVNVANLLVARGVARQREMAIRLSVGAGKAALMRQLLMESLVMAALGGCLGIAIAYGGTPALLHALSFDLSSASISARPDWQVMMFAAAVTFAAGLIFGLLPAWQSARTDVGAALKTEGSFGHTAGTGWLRRALVVGQVALSLVLLTSAILFTRSLRNLENIDVGFNTQRLLKLKVNPLQAGYSQARIKSFGEELRQKLMALPGVEAAGIATVPLLQDTDEGGEVTVEGSPAHSASNEGRKSYEGNSVSPGFFSTMQIPVIAGREFVASDFGHVAVVNETFAKRFLSGKNPVGMHLGFGDGDNVTLDQTIIGVVADSQHTSIRSPKVPFVYSPYLGEPHLSSLYVYVRLRSDQPNAAAAIRGLVHQMDAGLAVNDMDLMTDLIDESLFVERSLGYLSIGFALLATLLAVVGLYGVMSYSVTSRYRELGIRMAIGATPEGVLAMVLRESAYLGIGGAVCGIPIVLATTSSIRASLYGVQANDPWIWVSAVMLLIAIALLAGFVPAWQAARIDPHSALRAD